MTNKKIIQICFSLKTGLDIATIREKLTTLKGMLDKEYGINNYECRSCHLSRTLCKDKGFTTDIPDMFDSIFGDNYVCELESETSFNTAMAKIDDYRKRLASKADKMVIIENGDITNIALELKMFTNNRVMIL